MLVSTAIIECWISKVLQNRIKKIILYYSTGYVEERFSVEKFGLLQDKMHCTVDKDLQGFFICMILKKHLIPLKPGTAL